MMERTIVLNTWLTKSDKGELVTIIEKQTYITEDDGTEKALFKQIRTDKGYYVERVDSRTFKILQSSQILRLVNGHTPV